MTGGPADLRARAVHQLAARLDPVLVELYELDAGGETALLREGSGWRDGLVGRARVPAGADSPVGLSLAAEGPIALANGAMQPHLKPAWWSEHGAADGVMVAVRGLAGPWGALAVHATGGSALDAAGIASVSAAAGVIGLAVAGVA